MDIKVINARENMYILDDERVRCFLFVGKDKAMLIDSGFNDVDVVAVAKTITNLPIQLVLTHADGDHTGGLDHVGECYVHAKDMYLIKQEVVMHEIAEGDHICVGDYDLEVIHIPGHTYGSIALLEKNKRMILTGDSVQKGGPIYMFGEKRNLPMYIESLKKLEKMKDCFDVIYPSHYECPLEKEAIGKCLEDAIDLYEGRIPEYKKLEDMACGVYWGKYTGFLFRPEEKGIMANAE